MLKGRNSSPWETTFLPGAALSEDTFQDAALWELGLEPPKEDGVHIIREESGKPFCLLLNDITIMVV